MTTDFHGKGSGLLPIGILAGRQVMGELNNGRYKFIPVTVILVVVLALLIGGCSGRPDPDASRPGKNTGTEEGTVRLTDGTPVLDFYVRYFEGKGSADPGADAKVFAAKLSFCRTRGIAVDETEINVAADKAEAGLGILKNSEDESLEDCCCRVYNISLDEYKLIVLGYSMIEGLEMLLQEENPVSREETEEYLEKEGLLTADIIFLRAAFDGKTKPLLPDGITVPGYTDWSTEDGNFRELLEKIGSVLDSSEKMVDLIEINGLSGDGSTVFAEDVTDHAASAEEREKLAAMIDSSIKTNGDTCVFFDGKNYILLYCIEYGDDAGRTQMIDRYVSELTKQRAEKMIDDYVEALLG